MAKAEEKYNYKGITFARGYNEPFADFKKRFGHFPQFKSVPHLDRDNVLKSVHIEVLKHSKKQQEFDKKLDGSKNAKEDGNTKGASGSSSKAD